MLAGVREGCPWEEEAGLFSAFSARSDNALWVLQEDLVPVARELGIGFLAYSPLGRGMLTGAYKVQSDVPALQAGFNPRAGAEHFDKVWCSFTLTH